MPEQLEPMLMGLLYASVALVVGVAGVEPAVGLIGVAVDRLRRALRGVRPARGDAGRPSQGAARLTRADESLSHL